MGLNMDIEKQLIDAIHEESKKIGRNVSLMEVCGTHTMSIYRHGIKSLLPAYIRLISGPGCPVCVTPSQYIDQAVLLSRDKDIIICTFGDMVRVPGEKSSLEMARIEGGDIRIVYSPLDCIRIATENPNKKVVFLGVGFETTAPVIGLTIKKAFEMRIENFFVLSGIKRLFPVLTMLFSSESIKIDGLICPGHISTITGEEPYRFLPEQYKVPCVITGFEASEILKGIYLLIRQIAQGEAKVENAYKSAGTVDGNKKAIGLINEIFEPTDSSWRGFGIVRESGLKLNEKYRTFDAKAFFGLEDPIWAGDGGCNCGDVIKGLKEPEACPLFRKVCTPRTPKGACMVSSEGSCAARYKYGS